MSDGQEHDVDQLMADIEAGKPIQGGTDDVVGATPAETPAAAPQQAAPEQPAAWAPPEWAEFDWRGQRVKPDSAQKANIWMSQGYNYSQRMAEFNKKQAEFDRTRQEWEPKVKQYQEVDEYAAANPDWWEHVKATYQEKKNGAVAPEILALREELQSLQGLKAEWEQQKQAAAAAQEDQVLDQAIEATRKQFPMIDFAAMDAAGTSLQDRIMRHAVDTGLSTFRAATLDYLSDKLPSLFAAQGREAVVKKAAEAQKAGVIGRSPAPTKGLNGAGDIRGKSYDQLRDEGLREFGVIS